jgi:glycine oxidase
VVVAGGAWASHISIESAADKPVTPVRIEPVRGQMVCFQPSGRLARHVLYSARGYLVPRRDGRVLAGSTSESVGFDKTVTARGLQTILTHAVELAPGLAESPITEVWAGLRPRAEDGLPVIGPGPIDGLFYAVGHYRNGILLAPITGELLAQLIVDNIHSPLLAPFGCERFDCVAAMTASPDL